MNKNKVATLLFMVFSLSGKLAAQNESATIKSFFDEALVSGQSYEWLRVLCKDIGPRLAGSENMDKAAHWAKAEMEKIGFDSVWLQPVEVRHWVRGKREEAKLHWGKKHEPLAVTALGGSVPTPKKGLRAQVIEVQDFDELENLGEAAIKGKIVFYNRPMDPKFLNTGFAYGQAVNQRYMGTVEASKYGAVAVLVRSMTLRLDNYPHTGTMTYKEAKEKIPAAAVSTMGAVKLSETLKENPNTEITLWLESEEKGTAIDYNVVGEWRGTEKPDEIALVGGHLDSWDLAEGAHDDGVGCVQSMEAVRLLMKAGHRPKRTHRVVLFANEEFGLDGAREYARIAKEKNEKHVVAIESDSGSGIPRGFGISASDENLEKVRAFREELLPYGLFEFSKGGGGADISQLRGEGVTLIGFKPDNQRYFDYHHAATDVLENVHPRELALGAASIAALLFLLDLHF